MQPPKQLPSFKFHNGQKNLKKKCTDFPQIKKWEPHCSKHNFLTKNSIFEYLTNIFFQFQNFSVPFSQKNFQSIFQINCYKIFFFIFNKNECKVLRKFLFFWVAKKKLRHFSLSAKTFLSTFTKSNKNSIILM